MKIWLNSKRERDLSFILAGKKANHNTNWMSIKLLQMCGMNLLIFISRYLISCGWNEASSYAYAGLLLVLSSFQVWPVHICIKIFGRRIFLFTANDLFSSLIKNYLIQHMYQNNFIISISSSSSSSSGI